MSHYLFFFVWSWPERKPNTQKLELLIHCSFCVGRENSRFRIRRLKSWKMFQKGVFEFKSRLFSKLDEDDDDFRCLEFYPAPFCDRPGVRSTDCSGGGLMMEHTDRLRGSLQRRIPSNWSVDKVCTIQQRTAEYRNYNELSMKNILDKKYHSMFLIINI